MSHFYGVLGGSRGEATRCGTKKSGLVTYAELSKIVSDADGEIRDYLGEEHA